MLDALRRRDARRAAGGDREGRGPRALQGGDGEDRPRRARAPASAHSVDEAWAVVRDDRLPGDPAAVVHAGRHAAAASRTREDELETKVAWALAQSPTHEVLIEESVLGWKEFELEVMRDRADNFIVVCSIENIDPMGVHTGDSITVAPAMTLTDREYQRLRDAARAVMTEIGVETGGSNVQFAVIPKDGRVLRHRDEPARVALARRSQSKATGYPIAKIAAKLAVGYTLDELKNDITGHERRVRAGHRLRRREVAALRLREIPRRRHDARHADEERRRGDEHRPHVLRGAAEGGALARDGQATASSRSSAASTTACSPSRSDARDLGMEAPELEAPKTLPPPTRRRDARARSSSSSRRRRADRLFYVVDAMRARHHRRGAPRAHGDRPVVPRAAPAHRRRRGGSIAARRDSAPAQLREYKRLGFSDRADREARRHDARTTCARCASVAGHRAGLRARRHVRRRVRGAHAVPVLDLRVGERGAAEDATSRRSSSSAAGRTASGRASSSTTAACTRCMALRELGFETVMVNCNPETVSTDYDTSRPPLLRAAHARGRARRSATRRSPRASSCSSAGRRRSSSRCRSRSAA